jgi:hypothetical protein
MRQIAPKPWEKIGISRVTWYRHEKPTMKPPRGTLADSAGDLKNFGFNSIRSYQRTMRVMKSELWPYVDARAISVATADKILANPRFLRRFRENVAAAKAESTANSASTPNSDE